MKLIYHPAAEAEVVGAAELYEQKVPGLGTRFLDEFDQSVAAILEAPGRWRIIKDDKRRYLMLRFPYGIYLSHRGRRSAHSGRETPQPASEFRDRSAMSLTDP